MKMATSAGLVLPIMVMAFGLSSRLRADVVAYWPFGVNGLADASGNGHSLVKSDAGVYLTNGIARLDGSQTKFSTALPLNLSGYTNLTVEFWMRMSVTTNTCILVEHTDNYGLNPGAFHFSAAEGGAAGKVTGGFLTGSGYNLDETPPDVAANGEWHHVALVYDASKAGANRSVLYFDCVAQSTWSNFTNSGAATFRNAYFYIGSRANNSYKFSGELDDVRISNSALTTNQFLLSRSAENPDLVAYWPFDWGSELTDASGHSNTLVSGSGVVFSNGVAVMNGSQTAFSTAGSLNLASCSNLTVECFLRTTASGVPFMLLEHSSDVTNNPGAFALSSTGSTLLGGFRTDDGGNYDSSGTDTVLTNGAWHHLALVYDAASNGADRVRLYVDQVRQTPSDVYTNDVLSAFRSEILHIGSRASGDQPFRGELDDLRIVDAALTPDQFMKAHSDETPLVLAYWPFARGNEKTDASGHGFTLASRSASDVFFRDGATTFQGHSGLYTSTRLDLSPFKAVTFEGFIRTVSTSQPLLAELSGNYNNNVGTFAVSAGMFTNNAMGAGYRTNKGYNIEYAPQGAISDGAWHHVAYVINLAATSSVDRSQLYLDRKRLTKSPNLADATATPFASDQLLFLGWRGSSSELNFSGDMDDIRITTTALTTNEFMSSLSRTADTVTNAVIAYWPFNASDGLADASGHGNMLTGSGVIFTNGAATFGGSQTIKTANKLDLSLYSAVTIEYFIRTTSKALQIVLEHSSDINTHPGGFYTDVCEFNAGALAAAFKTSTGHNIESSAASTVSDGQWHHVAIIIDTTKSGADRLQLYLDNVRQAKTGGYNSSAATSLISDYLYLGSRNASSYRFIGSIDDLRITGKALNVSEFLARPTATLPPVIAYWPFIRNHELEDASGNGYSLTNNGVTFNAPSGSAAFDGCQATFNTLKALNLRFYEALTVECFVKSTAPSLQMLLETSTNAPLYQGAFSLASLASSGFAESALTTAFYTYFGTPGTSYKYNLDRSGAGSAVTDGKWHHLAFVIDSSKSGADRARLYFDRTLQTAATGNHSDLITDLLNSPLYIGSRANSLYKFSGELDDIRISGSALTTNQFLTQRSIPLGTLVLMR